LMKDNRLSDLSNMFTLIERVPGGRQELLAAFGKYVKSAGTDIVSNPNADPEKDKHLVQNLLGESQTIVTVI